MIHKKYSLEGLASLYELSIEEFTQSVEEHTKYKKDLMQKYKNKGYTDEHAKNIVMKTLYAPNYPIQHFLNKY